MTRVLNRAECGVNTVQVILGHFYGRRWFSASRLAVSHVQIIENNNTGLKPMRLGRWLQGFQSEKTEFNMDLDLYLVDGRVIEIQTTDKEVIREALRYMTVADDPRKAYRAARRVTIDVEAISGPTGSEEEEAVAEMPEEISSAQYRELIKEFGTDSKRWNTDKVAEFLRRNK